MSDGVGQHEVSPFVRPKTADLDNSLTRKVFDWEGPNDPENPKNWPNMKLWRITLLNSLFMFVSPVSSSMVAPAFSQMRTDFSLGNDFETQMILSIFVLASTTGPLIISPLSELYGRRPVLHITCLIYLIFNLACPFAKNKAQLVAFRFLSEVGGSAASIGGGILADCWRNHERGLSLSVYYIFPLIGSAVGPILGGFVIQNSSWHWLFYATSILSATIQICGFFRLPETYGPTILRRRVKVLRITAQNRRVYTLYDNESYGNTSRHAMIRPFKLLLTQPIIWVLALFIAYVFGLMYLALSTYFDVWINVYKEIYDIAGLNYISLGLGFTCATQICAPFNDMYPQLYARLKCSNNGIGEPEFRIPLLVPGVLLLLIGFCCVYAASAIAATTVLRAITAFAFPLFAPYIYKSLEYGWGNSLLAFAAIVLGWPAVWLFWEYGESLRHRSRYTAQPSD